MSPPEVWGPAVWRLLHTLAEKINEHIYPSLSNELFQKVVQICKNLPCPDCAKHASSYLQRVKRETIRTKTEFINTLYLFHNYVNARKKKALFNYANIHMYKNGHLTNIINDFILKYNTKGNMKLLNESFQRNLVVKDLKKWIVQNIRAFYRPKPLPPIPANDQNANDQKEEQDK
jgi:hypothetical protein